jgi:hypothetical protein
MNRTALRVALTLTSTVALGLVGAGTASAAGDEFVYNGTAEITVAQYGYCGFSSEPAPIGQRSFTAPVTLVVGDPAADSDGGAEQNPVHFTVQTDQQGPTGAWSVTTGLVATTPDTGRDLAVQYWTNEYDPETGRLAGRLTNDHKEEALAYNLVNVEQLLVPCRPELGTIPMVAAMGEGTELAGTLDADQASIEIAGVSSDGLTQYHIVTSLQRSS